MTDMDELDEEQQEWLEMPLAELIERSEWTLPIDDDRPLRMTQATGTVLGAGLSSEPWSGRLTTHDHTVVAGELTAAT